MDSRLLSNPNDSCALRRESSGPNPKSDSEAATTDEFDGESVGIFPSNGLRATLSTFAAA